LSTSYKFIIYVKPAIAGEISRPCANERKDVFLSATFELPLGAADTDFQSGFINNGKDGGR
jgi:hypothetical protein